MLSWQTPLQMEVDDSFGLLNGSCYYGGDGIPGHSLSDSVSY